eukprot:scaffold326215_cov80-Tisochrysis_lutea.AAC.2
MASGREHARDGEGEGDAGQQHDAHACRERRRALVQLHRAHRVVVRSKGRRARCIHSDARALHPEHEGQAARGNRVRRARCGVHVAREGRLQSHKFGEVVRRDPHKHTGLQARGAAVAEGPSRSLRSATHRNANCRRARRRIGRRRAERA